MLTVPQCPVLRQLLPGKVFTDTSSAYQDSLQSYWSLQESEVEPRCIVRPESVEDVQLAVAILSAGEKFIPGHCQFAVRSGG